MQKSKPIRVGDLVRLLPKSIVGTMTVDRVPTPGIIVDIDTADSGAYSYRALVQWPNHPPKYVLVSQLENLSGRISIIE
jgi:hypothetical protein